MEYGSGVAAILEMAKHYVLDWFIPCDKCGLPIWKSAPVCFFWISVFLSLAARVMLVVMDIMRKAKKQEATEKTLLENIVMVVQAALTSFAFMFFPLICYSFAFINEDSQAQYASLSFAIILLLSQTIGHLVLKWWVGLIAYACIAVLPGIMAFLSGYGSPRLAFLVVSIASSVIFPLANTLVLYSSFFAKDYEPKGKVKMFFLISIAIRAGSAIFGFIFFILLAFELSPGTSGAAAFFWFMWIIIPWGGSVTLILSVPDHLESAVKKQKEIEEAKKKKKEEKEKKAKEKEQREKELKQKKEKQEKRRKEKMQERKEKHQSKKEGGSEEKKKEKKEKEEKNEEKPSKKENKEKQADE